VEGASITTACAALRAAGAAVHLIAPRLGPVKPVNGAPFEATGTLENSAPVLFDGLVLPDGADGVKALAARMETRDFIAEQYRHGKTILAMGASSALLDRAGIPAALASGEPDPGLVRGDAMQGDRGVAAFIIALGRHRHPERETGAAAG
jgi:catalase